MKIGVEEVKIGGEEVEEEGRTVQCSPADAALSALFVSCNSAFGSQTV